MEEFISNSSIFIMSYFKENIPFVFNFSNIIKTRICFNNIIYSTNMFHKTFIRLSTFHKNFIVFFNIFNLTLIDSSIRSSQFCFSTSNTFVRQFVKMIQCRFNRILLGFMFNFSNIIDCYFFETRSFTIRSSRTRNKLLRFFFFYIPIIFCYNIFYYWFLSCFFFVSCCSLFSWRFNFGKTKIF